MQQGTAEEEALQSPCDVEAGGHRTLLREVVEEHGRISLGGVGGWEV